MTVRGGRRVLPRQWIGLGVHGLAVGVLVVVYATVAPPSHWDQMGLVAVIALLAAISVRSEVPLPGGITFDASIALMLLAVVVAGPLPALAVFLAPWVVDLVTRPRQAFRAGQLANLALNGSQAVAGAIVLSQVPHGASWITLLAWLLLTGWTQFVLGWAVGPAVYATLWLGHPLRALTRTLVDMVPAATVMVLVGAATVLLTPSLGVLALALFAAIVVAPQSFLTYAARTRPIARLDRATATRRYVYALGEHLGLSRADRRHVARVTTAALRRPPTGEAVDYAAATLRDPSPENLDAQVVTEWWNGRGGPLGLSGETIPLAARVLAVADTWSSLTASGSPRLGHTEVLELLRAAAGTRLDPAVVDAAAQVVAQERVSASEPAPEPRLHHLRLPAALRRTLAGA
jgi:HD domain